MQRFRHALAMNWLSSLAIPFAVPIVVLIFGGTVPRMTLVLALGGYVLMVAFFVAVDVTIEGKMREVARRMGWAYSIWGRPAVEYGISAPPFVGAGRLRTSSWARGVFRERRYETFYIDTDALRLGPQVFVLAVPLDREFPTVRLTLARGSEHEMQGQTATSTEVVEFNRRWRVQGPDPEFAHAFLSPLVVRRLLAEPNPPQSLTLSGRFIFVHGKLRNVLAAGRLPLLADLVDLIPGGVVAKFSRDRRSLPGAGATPVEAVLARDRPRDSTVFGLPGPRPWVVPVAVAVTVLVPVVGPIVGAVLLGRESRRGIGSSWMLLFAVALGLGELVVVFVLLFMV